jgi:hypothetical protein
MDKVATLLQWELSLLLVGLGVIVFYQMLTGRINTRGLLWEKDGAANYSWGRVQLLFFTLIFALMYVGKVIQSSNGFPDVPQELLVLLGGSNSAYLGQKAFNLLRGVLPKT